MKSYRIKDKEERDSLSEILSEMSKLQLKKLRSVMMSRLKYAQSALKEIGIKDPGEYLHIKGSENPLTPNLDAIEKYSAENPKKGLALSMLIGGMCEMSEIIVSISSEVRKK